MVKEEMASRLKDVVNSHAQIFLESSAVVSKFPSRDTEFLSLQQPSSWVTDKWIANEVSKIKGYDKNYAVPKQGASLNAAVKSSSMHMGAKAIPKGKQTHSGSFCNEGREVTLHGIVACSCCHNGDTSCTLIWAVLRVRRWIKSLFISI